ncbi:MAG: hypothetical protein K9N35_02705 [Candidatus Marinimicrobia bacterium]|nr:hypothetical protein [Candidatus Neomarinimicrobiota bacterium]
MFYLWQKAKGGFLEKPEPFGHRFRKVPDIPSLGAQKADLQQQRLGAI